MPWTRLSLSLLVLCAAADAPAEVLVRWSVDQVPSRDSLGISTLVVPAANAALARDAAAAGYRVYVEVDGASLSVSSSYPGTVSGVIVKGAVAPAATEQLRARMRARGARVIGVEDEHGVWPHVRLNWVTLRDDVLQVASRTTQPWVDSNAVFSRIAAPADGSPLLLSYAWEPITAADTDRGPALEDYLVAIAEAGSFGHDLVLPLHERFQRDLVLGRPAAREAWRQIRRHLEFYGWDLPRRYRRLSDIGMLVADPMGSVEILRLLTRHNLPFELVPAEAGPERLKPFAMVVALDPPTPGQVRALTAFARGGGTVVLNGPLQDGGWEGAGPPVENERQVTYSVGDGRLVKRREAIADPNEFALDVRDMLGPERRVVDVWNGITVLVAPYEAPDGEAVLVTALNYAHVPQPIQLRVRGTFSGASVESPDAPAALVPVRHRDGFTEFVLPALRIGGRVFLSRDHRPSEGPAAR